MIHWSWFNLDKFKFHKLWLPLVQFQIEICLAHFQVEKHGIIFFQIYVFLKFFFPPNTIFESIFFIAFQLFCIPFFSMEFEFS
jgi:hypothetical protein